MMGELARIRDKELRRILRRLKKRIRERGGIPLEEELVISGSPGDSLGRGEEIMGVRVDIYRYGQVVGRFRCPGYEPYSVRDAVCKFFVSSCGENPGYKDTDGLLCYPSSPRNDEILEVLRGTLGDEIVFE